MKRQNWQTVSTGLHRRAALPLACYFAALIGWLALGLWNFGSDSLAEAQGRLYEQAIELTEWQLVDIEPYGGAYVTTSGDPQIILEDVSDRVVRTLRYSAEWLDNEPREMCLYYTTRVGEPYSQDRRVFPQVAADGSYLYTLPRTSIVSLRLDPCSPDENKSVTFAFVPAAIELNAALPAFWQYFIPSWYQAFCLVLYPALAASALHWLLNVVRRLRRR